MSREEWKNFLQAVERSPGLRKELQSKQAVQDIVQLGRQYGYAVRLKDLTQDAQTEKISHWFEQSTIL